MCWECDCTCNTNRTCSCPSITGSWQVDIDTSTEGVVDIFAPENNTVSSDDGSVNITETTNSEGSVNYDLSVECCDKYVWACANDPLPSTLDNKLFVSSPLTKTVSNCNTDGKVTIWINTSLLADEKVKAQAWCTSWYLVDTIEAWDWIRTYVSWCKLVIEAEPTNFVRPMAKLMLSADYEVNKTHGLVEDTESEGWFIIPTTVEEDNNGSSMANRITFWTGTYLWQPTKYIQVNKSWFYEVGFKFNCDINYGVHALRWCVFSSMPWKAILLDDKDQWESYGFAISTNTTIDAKTDVAYSKQLSFQNIDITYLTAWTRIILWWRMDPYVINWHGAWEDGWALIRRAGLDGWVIQWGTATENSEAWCTLTVTWHSDADGWILYK